MSDLVGIPEDRVFFHNETQLEGYLVPLNSSRQSVRVFISSFYLLSIYLVAVTGRIEE